MAHRGRRRRDYNTRRGRGGAVNLRGQPCVRLRPSLGPAEEVAPEAEQDREEDQREGDDYNQTHDSPPTLYAQKLWPD